MIQLTYTSQSTQPVTPSLVLDMLESARRNNAPQGVGGLLYYAQGQFAQVLEGNAGDVEAIYDKICADPRHRDIKARRTDITVRAFADWSMAFVDTSTAEAARVLLSHKLDTYESSKWPADEVGAVLESLAYALKAERIPVTY